MSPKVKREGSLGLGLLIYHFLLVFRPTSNIYPKLAPLWYTSLENPSDLDFNI